MKNSSKLHVTIVAAALALSPTSLSAQGTATADANVVNTTDMNATDSMGTTAAPMADSTANDMALAQTVQPEREDHDFPWGLLGLLGLAGLLGRKRRDDDHVRVDRTNGTTTNNRI